jgi:aspartyl-tRNA(Asn)/glutamyl-tRNA(Gln) amidotransferase subunit A
MFGNQFDLTSISLPIRDTERPVGLMLVARNGHDRRLLEIAASVETMLAQET